MSSTTIKRERSANFSNEETRMLINLVQKYSNIIESKKTDAFTNKSKEAAWNKVANSFNAHGLSNNARTMKTLKLKYEGLKKNTKKKLLLHRQELYKAGGGGPSKAPDFDEIDEKVLSICKNLTDIDARHDADTNPAGFEEIIVDDYLLLESQEEQDLNMSSNSLPDETNHSYFTKDTEAEDKLPDENQAHKENEWTKWHPKALKTKVSNALKDDTVTKSRVSSQLDKLRTARMELVQLQIMNAKKQLEFFEKEHEMKMQSLTNEENRKVERHKLIMEKISSGSLSGFLQDSHN